MKNFVRLAVAGAIAASYSVGAFAQLGPAIPNTPDTGTADLWVFVSDPGAQDSFAVDTGISLSSLQPGSYTTGAKLVNDSNGGFSVSSAALASFISGSTDASALTYGLEGVQYKNGNFANAAAEAPGADIAAFSAAKTTGAGLVTNMNFTNMKIVAPGFNGDITYLLNSSPNGYSQGGSVFNWSDGSSGGNVWGAGAGNTGGSTNLYGQGPTQSGLALGTAANLYDLTGNGTTSNLQSYLLGTVTVSANGTISNVAPAPVPLPAAVWLFGSGLLGLFGVGRRRAA
jgi:hypothetical protein